MTKIYDARIIGDYIDDRQAYIRQYTDRMSDLYDVCQQYINNDMFRGDAADASKMLTKLRELTILEAIVNSQNMLLDLYKHMHEAFLDVVDSDPNARINMDVLYQTLEDFNRFYNDLDDHARVIEQQARELQNEFGYITSFVQPNFDSVRAVARQIIGGDGNVGLIPDLIERFNDFDEYESNYRNNVDLSSRIDDIRKQIERLNAELDDVALLNPDIDIYNLFLVKYDDRELAIKKLKKYVASMALYLLGAKDKCTVCVSDPVNACSGNYINEKVDITLKGRYPIEFKRFYNALSNKTGALGLGWTHSFEKRILKEEDNLFIDLIDGSRGSFVKVHDNEYREEHGEQGVLTVLNNGYEIRYDSGRFEKFDSEGYMIASGDNDGENISLSYVKSEGGKRFLSKVEAKNKNSLTFSYIETEDNKGLISKITDQTGRSICYAYDDKRLTKITELDGGIRQFTYTSDNLIKEVINPKGIVAIKNEYDEKQRTVKQTFPDDTVISFEYDDDKDVTIVTEQNANTITYTHDEFGRHIKTDYYDGSESYSYNSRNQKISFTDKKGNITRFSYDNKGHLTKIVDAKGNKTSITYRADGKPMSVKGAKGEVYKYTYGTSGKLFEIRNPLGETNRFYYQDGNLEQTRNAAGALTSFTYDERGNVNTITDPDGVVTEYEYDKLNRVVKTITADGAVTKYEYDDADRITRTTDALGNTREYTYDEMGKVVAAKEADGTVKNFEINVMGRVSKIVDEAGNVTEITYNEMGKQEEVCLPNGGVIKYEYDPLMRLTKVTDPEGRTTGYDYDANGNVVAEYLGDVKVRSLEYDVLNQVVKEIDAMGHTKTYEYDENGNVVAISDTNGNKTIRQYDLLGRVTKEIDPLGNETSYTYTKLGDIETITDHVGRVRKYEYTDSGKLKAIYFCETKEQELAYDNVGRVAKRTFADGYVLSYSYDVLSRIAKVEGSDGRVVAYEYDAMGRATKVMDGRSTTLYTYTPTGHLKSVVDALGNETAYTYDSLDNLKSIQRAEGRIENVDASLDDFPTVGKDGHVTLYSYDLSGQLTKVTDALGQVETYEYDQYGRLVSKTDRDNYTTTYGYNVLGAITKVGYADGRSVEFVYDELGRLNQFKDWLGTNVIERDVLGRALSVLDYKGRKVSYTYGRNNERTSITYPDGKKIDYIYDDRLRLSELVNGNEKTSYTYDDYNRLIEKTLPNANKEVMTYYRGGHLKSLEMYDSNGILDKYIYGYDNQGNRTEIDRTRRNLEDISGKYKYEYDYENRLTSVALNGNILRSYSYDAFGNRSTFEEEGKATFYKYDVLDRLLETVTDSKAITYEYDGRGNVAKEFTDGLLTKTFTFDATNMLTKAKDVEKGEAIYTYNGMGKRVATQNPTESIDYLLDLTKDYHNMLERTVNGETETYTYDGNVVSMSKHGEDYFYMLDELGSGMYLTGTDGESVSTYAYDEFGRNIDSFTGKTQKPSYTKQGNVIQPLAFTGYQNDEMTGSYFAQARYYNSNVGRFVSEDKVRGFIDSPDSINHYLYCTNSPILSIDRNGLYPQKEYELEVRSDVNGICILEGTNTIVTGCNANINDAYTLIVMDCMTDMGAPQEEIDEFVDKYISKNPDTVITAGKDISYYRNQDDVTYELNKFMIKCEYEMGVVYPYLSLEDFYNKVRNKGPWDLKNVEGWKASTSMLLYDGELVDRDAPGNIMYGYMGKAYYVPDLILQLGAGYAQLSAGTSKQEWLIIGGDDPIDELNVDRGIRRYNGTHKCTQD